MASRVIQVELVGDSTQLNRALGQAQTSLGRFGGKLQATGRAMTRTLTLPIVGAAAAATKYTYDFDQSLNHIQALVGANTKQMEAYRASILRLAPTVGQGPDELAKALYFITSSGFQGAKALDVLRASARAASAGLGDTQQVADLVTTAVSAYGVKTLSAAHATDVLTAAVRLGKAEPADFVSALGRVIPVAQAMGVSFGEVSGAVAALTVSGQNTEIAVTGIRQVLLNILKPSSQARDALHGVGLSTQELQRVVSRQGIVPALELLNTKFHGNRQEMSKVISNARSLTVAMALIGPNAQKASSTIDQVTHSSGEAAKAFQTQSQTMAFQVQKAWATIQTSAVQVGSIILPVFADVATRVAKVASAFGTLPSGMQEVVVGAALGVAALGPLLTALGHVTVAAGALTSGLRLLTGAETLATAGAAGLGGAFVIIASAVALAAYGISQANKTTYLTSGLFKDAADNVNGLANAFRNLQDTTSARKNALLQEKQSALGVRDAHKALTDYLTGGGKRGTLEYKHLVLGVKQAEQSLSDSTVHARQSLVDHSNALRKYHGVVNAAKTATRTLNAQIQAEINLYTKFDGSSKDRNRILQQYSAGMYKLAGREGVAAQNLRRLGDEAGARLAKKLQIASEWAGALAASLGRIPTHIDVQVAVQGARVDAARGEGTNKYARPHTGGLITGTGLVRFAGGGIALGGTRGLDSIPALLTPGEVVLNKKQQLALLNGGTPSVVQVFIGDEQLEQRMYRVVDSTNHQTAQKLRSGRKWG